MRLSQTELESLNVDDSIPKSYIMSSLIPKQYVQISVTLKLWEGKPSLAQKQPFCAIPKVFPPNKSSYSQENFGRKISER
jgi:hypothetical protein